MTFNLDPPPQLPWELIKAFADGAAISDKYSRYQAIAELVPQLQEVLFVDLPIPQKFYPPWEFPEGFTYEIVGGRACGMAAILPYIPISEKHAFLDPILEIISGLLKRNLEAGVSLGSLAVHLPESLIHKAVSIATTIPLEYAITYPILYRLASILPESDKKNIFVSALIENPPKDGDIFGPHVENYASIGGFLMPIAPYFQNNFLDDLLSVVVRQFEIKREISSKKKKKVDSKQEFAKLDHIDTNVVQLRFEKNSDGTLTTTEKEKRIQLLKAYCASANIPESDWTAYIEKAEIERTRLTCPKWVGRLERGGELAALSAPLFLKRVHADYISEDGTVENETIRTIDPDLMNAVEIYMAQRRSYAKKTGQPLDMKDAEGLEPIGYSAKVTFKPMLPHNELIAMAFKAVRQGNLGPYDTFELSCSSSENPIQMAFRHQSSGRIKIANIDRCNGSIGWDSDFSIPWN